MKKLILPFLIFLSFNQIATAGTCDTKLTQKKSYSYKTINQTFTCLNNQINQLQNEVDIIKGFGTPEIYPKFTSVYFDLEVLSFIRGKGSLLMKVKLTNKSGVETYLSNGGYPRIMDSEGHVCETTYITNSNQNVPIAPPSQATKFQYN